MRRLTFFVVAILALPLATSAVTVSWDRPTAGIINPLFILDTVKGNIFTATSTTGHSTFPFASTTALSATTLCLTGDTCRTTWPTAGGSGNVATSTTETPGALPYWTSNGGTPATLGKTSTTTLAGTGIVSVSNSPFVIGGSASVVSITGGSGGQIIAWSGGIPTWVATTTFTGTAPISLSYSNGVVTASCSTCNTSNATVSSITAGTGLNGGTITTSGTLSLVSYLATSSAETGGQLAAWGTTSGTPAKLYSVATTSVSCSGNILCTGFSALGSASTISFTGTLAIANGGTGTSTTAAGYAAYWGTTTMLGTPTTTASCSGGTSCSSFNVFGSSAVTISSFSYPWTTATTFGATRPATTTAIYYQSGLFASSTSQFSFASSTQITSSGNLYLPGLTSGQLAYIGGTDQRLQGVATTSISCSGNITCTGFTGLGSASTISFTGTLGIGNGGTGTTTTAAGYLTYWGTGSLLGIATSTASCSGTVSCSSFTILGGSNVTITGSASSATDPFTHPAAGQSATTSLLILSGNASSTEFSSFQKTYFGATATSSFDSAGVLSLATALTVGNGGTGAGTFTAGNVLYGSGTNQFGTVATGTISGSSPLSVTASRFVLGGSATVSWDFSVANSWTGLQQFNANASTTKFSCYGPCYFGATATSSFNSAGVPSFPLTGILQGGGAGNNVTAISDSSTVGQVLRVTGASTYAWGALNLASSNAVTGTLPYGNGGTGTTTGVTGQLAYFGPSAYMGVATTSVTCSGGISCSSFNVLGSSAITLSSAAYPWTAFSTYGTTTVSTSTSIRTAGAFFASSTIATSTLDGALRVGANSLTPYLIVASTTAPNYGYFTNDLVDVYDKRNDELAINIGNGASGSCASASLVMDGDIPTASNNFFQIAFLNSGWTGSGCALNAKTGAVYGDGILYNPTGGIDLMMGTTSTNGALKIFTKGTAGGNEIARFTNGGSLGIATTTPWALLSLNANGLTGPAFNIGSTTGSYFTINQAGGIELSANQPSTSTAITLDWSNTSPQVEYRIGASATTITLINATTSRYWGSRKLVVVCNPAQTAGALTWAGVEWIGSAPTQTTTSNQCDFYSFTITRATSTSVYKVAGTAGTGFQ